MKNFFSVLLILLFAVSFIWLIYKYFPLGIALAITGGCFGFHANFPESRSLYWIGITGTWLIPAGIIIGFIQNGWLIGLLAIPAGFIAYLLAKR